MSPLYEYVCENGHRFEKVQRMGDAPVEKCSECPLKAERVISLPRRAIVYGGTPAYDKGPLTGNEGPIDLGEIG